MAFAEALDMRRQPRIYKKDIRTRTKMSALEGDASPMAVWCMGGMKSS